MGDLLASFAAPLQAISLPAFEDLAVGTAYLVNFPGLVVLGPLEFVGMVCVLDNQVEFVLVMLVQLLVPWGSVELGAR